MNDDRLRPARHSLSALSSEGPFLVVCGEYHHFRQSVLGKINPGNFRALDLANWIANGRPGPAAFIRWAPYSHYQIHDEVRSLIPSEAHIVNDTSFSCSKDNVHRHFAAVFGRRLDIDPLTYCGPAVMKSKRNATHDGVITEFPRSEVLNDRVYERLIDNRHDENLILDIRLPLIFGKPPLAYLKYRLIGTRFSNENASCELVDPANILSQDELRLCGEFARSIGLEYGELDVLRDRNSREIFIVDANNTPFGPPNGLPDDQAKDALKALGEAIVGALFGPCPCSKM